MLGVEIAGLRVDELAALLLGGLRRIIFAATTGTLSPYSWKWSYSTI
jgi:hypothetical protein